MTSLTTSVQAPGMASMAQATADTAPFRALIRGRVFSNEYLVATAILGALTGVGMLGSISYQAMGHLYLLAVLAVSMRVGRGPAVFTAMASALVWNGMFIPPRFSLRVVSFDDGLLLATYFIIALSGSYWTACVQARQKLRAAAERETLLKESNRLHRTLLDSVSHELNTPLAVLRSATEEFATPDRAKRELLAREIGTATHRLNRLMNNLVHRSRLDAGPLQPRFDWCDVHDLFHAARVGAADLLEGRVVAVEIPDDLPWVHADPLLMEQVLINLVSNAARHTAPECPIRLVATRGDRDVHLAVIDHGPGIAAGRRENLFRKFERGTPAGAAGLGLGLSIAHALVQAQHGTLRYDDVSPSGACFTISLPVREPAPPADHEC